MTVFHFNRTKGMQNHVCSEHEINVYNKAHTETNRNPKSNLNSQQNIKGGTTHSFHQELDAELEKCGEEIKELKNLSDELVPSVSQHDQQLVHDHIR